MVQVDVFWTFGIGAAFAAAARKQINKEREKGKKWYESYSFLYSLLFSSLLFAPSGVYLLWTNTGWESMYMLNKNMPAVIPLIFATTNVLFSILGYWIAYKFVASGNRKAAHATWIFGWGMMVVILTMGWRRFIYAGTFEDWNGNIPNWHSYIAEPLRQYALTDFFSSHIFWSLVAMGIIAVPAIFIPIIKWAKE